MPTFDATIDDLVAGDHRWITRSVTNLPSGYLLDKAWMTVKTNPATDADPGIFQKAITTSNVTGTGQITDTGVSGTGAIRFDLAVADTVLLTPGTEYTYDIQVRMSNGSYTIIETVEIGTVTTIQGVTATTT